MISCEQVCFFEALKVQPFLFPRKLCVAIRLWKLRMMEGVRMEWHLTKHRQFLEIQWINHAQEILQFQHTMI